MDSRISMINLKFICKFVLYTVVICFSNTVSCLAEDASAIQPRDNSVRLGQSLPVTIEDDPVIEPKWPNIPPRSPLWSIVPMSKELQEKAQPSEATSGALWKARFETGFRPTELLGRTSKITFGQNRVFMPFENYVLSRRWTDGGFNRKIDLLRIGVNISQVGRTHTGWYCIPSTDSQRASSVLLIRNTLGGGMTTMEDGLSYETAASDVLKGRRLRKSKKGKGILVAW
jgi:hypothetical protein